MLNTKSSQFSTQYFISKIAFCMSVRQRFMGHFLQSISFKMTMVCKASIFCALLLHFGSYSLRCPKRKVGQPD